MNNKTLYWVGWIGVLVNSIMLIVNALNWKGWMVATSCLNIAMSLAAVWLFSDLRSAVADAAKGDRVSGTTRDLFGDPKKYGEEYTDEIVAKRERIYAGVMRRKDPVPDGWCPLCGQTPCKCFTNPDGTPI